MKSDELPGLIGRVFTSLQQLQLTPASSDDAGGNAAEPPQSRLRPAVPVSESLTPDHLICLEDGRPVKLLHRYLKQHFGMTPAEYRQKWDLPASYPMVAPSYSDSRRDHGIKVGFKKRSAPTMAELKTKAKSPKARAAAKATAPAPAAKSAKPAKGVKPAGRIPAASAPVKPAAPKTAKAKAAKAPPAAEKPGKKEPGKAPAVRVPRKPAAAAQSQPAQSAQPAPRARRKLGIVAKG